jgi:hypothetical protein
VVEVEADVLGDSGGLENGISGIKPESHISITDYQKCL